MNKLTILLFALFVASCATPVAQQHVSLEDEKICCADVSLIPKTLIEAEKETKIPFEKGSPVFDYGAGKSFTTVLELPRSNNDYIVITRSSFNGFFEIGQFFQPIFISMNEDYQVLDVFTLNMEFFIGTWTRSAHMGAGFKLPNSVRYLAVFTSQLDKKAQVANIPPSTSVELIGDIPIVTSRPGRGYELTPTPTGVVSFKLIPDEGIPSSQ